MSARLQKGEYLKDGRYLLEEPIGDGAIATVWRAKDVQSGEPVAIKILRDEALDLEDVQRLAQEVEILRHLDHPGIVKLHGTGVTGWGCPFVIMEHVKGIDLRREIDEKGAQELVEVSDIVSQICGALAEAHAHGVIHRDVKPENVLLCAPEHRTAKLVDFGMAKVLGPRAAALTLDNKIFGTPQYMAPERASGKPVSEAADVYSAAVITYEMLAGRRPFDGKNPIQVLTLHLTAAPPPLGVHPEVERVVLRALSKRASDRPTAQEFSRLLAEAVALAAR
jgi:eukaryotic-like serine/threonine-protein kinase